MGRHDNKNTCSKCADYNSSELFLCQSCDDLEKSVVREYYNNKGKGENNSTSARNTSTSQPRSIIQLADLLDQPHNIIGKFYIKWLDVIYQYNTTDI